MLTYVPLRSAPCKRARTERRKWVHLLPTVLDLKSTVHPSPASAASHSIPSSSYVMTKRCSPLTACKAGTKAKAPSRPRLLLLMSTYSSFVTAGSPRARAVAPSRPKLLRQRSKCRSPVRKCRTELAPCHPLHQSHCQKGQSAADLRRLVRLEPGL